MSAQGTKSDYAAARAAMIESQLRPQGVTDRRVLDAMGNVARELFVPEAARSSAYSDRSVPLGNGRYLSAPAVLGQLLSQMMPMPGERALVVGAASGYSAAVLSAIGLNVVAIERDADLAVAARKLGAIIIDGPLEDGHKKGGPYDLILIDGAVEFIPDAIVDQLADGGRLGTALVDRGITRLIVGRKAGGAFGYLSIGDSGVPVLSGFIRPKAFTF